jgi:urease accessory protein
MVGLTTSTAKWATSVKNSLAKRMTSPEIHSALTALHLASPALPVGAFAYSQGLEQAIEEGLVRDQPSAQGWIEDVLLLSLAQQELVLWREVYGAVNAQDTDRLVAANQLLIATRETAEFRLETIQMGQSMSRLFDQWPGADSLTHLRNTIKHWAYPAAVAACSAATKTPEDLALAAYAWSWVENQVLAAVKHIPLGHSSGQVVLHNLKPAIEKALVLSAACSVHDIGSAAFGLAITSCRHETQYSRLFRS